MKSIKIRIIFFSIFTLICSSCIDTDLESVLDYDNHYKTIPDADNAIVGLYGTFMKLAEQTVVLGELRGDLVDVTQNSTVELQEINTNSPSVSNKYADITNYYFVIQNCNDMMAGFDKMMAENRLTKDEHAERYSDVAAIRCWTYLQLGIHFGGAVYVTDPTVTIQDVEKLEQQEKLSFDKLLDELIKCMEELPTLDAYKNSQLIQETVSTYELKRFFINKRLLLGDLYLWRGKNESDDFNKAATQYRKILATDEDKATSLNQYTYRCGTYSNPSTAGYFQIVYSSNTMYNTWLNMFSYAVSSTSLWYELIWTISYNKSYEPYYPFIDLFANTGAGKYLLKPSDYAINDLWETQEQKNGTMFDGRGRESSFKLVNGNYVVQKYLYDYDPTKPYEKGGRWFLYRAALVLLRYAEAANRAGKPLLAYSILNEGFKNTYTSRETGYEDPYYFDARNEGNHTAPWRQFNGIRGRAYLNPKTLPSGISQQDSIRIIEKYLIEEAALECGFEGHRWGDLIRVARRKNKEDGSGSTYLQDVIRPKYEKSGHIMPDYSSEEKWYISISK